MVISNSTLLREVEGGEGKPSMPPKQPPKPEDPAKADNDDDEEQHMDDKTAQYIEGVVEGAFLCFFRLEVRTNVFLTSNFFIFLPFFFYSKFSKTVF